MARATSQRATQSGAIRALGFREPGLDAASAKCASVAKRVMSALAEKAASAGAWVSALPRTGGIASTRSISG
jgi:hypothetical protein